MADSVEHWRRLWTEQTQRAVAAETKLEAAEATLAAVRGLADEHITEPDMMVNGCFTGDCPHTMQGECNAHLREEYVTLCVELRRTLGERDE